MAVHPELGKMLDLSATAKLLGIPYQKLQYQEFKSPKPRRFNSYFEGHEPKKPWYQWQEIKQWLEDVGGHSGESRLSEFENNQTYISRTLYKKAK
jgi:hypothetical protein